MTNEQIATLRRQFERPAGDQFVGDARQAKIKVMTAAFPALLDIAQAYNDLLAHPHRCECGRPS